MRGSYGDVIHETKSLWRVLPTMVPRGADDHERTRPRCIRYDGINRLTRCAQSAFYSTDGLGTY